MQNLESFDSKQYIIIKNAKVNNLKGVDVVIPRNKLVVITGLSGSGKSSLAFDTLFAEGQRMYVESLSSYARQFLGRMEKPDVEYIKGVAPAIAVEQKGNSSNPRATVGTTTEIYDYLKLLFARLGKTYSPTSGKIVKKDTVTSVVDEIQAHEEGAKLLILAPIQKQEGRTWTDEIKVIFQKGFTRVAVGEDVLFIEEILKEAETDAKKTEKRLASASLFTLIDRGVVRKEDEDNQFRLADSVQTAFYEGHGVCVLDFVGKERKSYSDKFEADGIVFEEPSIQFFSFNNPYGACKKCGGFGTTLGVDEHLVITDRHKSVYEGAVTPWRTEKMSAWRDDFVRKAMDYDFPVHRAYQDLNEKELHLLWHGNKKVKGIWAFFEFVESKIEQIQYRVMLSKYRARVTCPDCKGSRLRPDAQYVKVNGKSITDLVLLPIQDALQFFTALPAHLSEADKQIADRLLAEIINRLAYLEKVGLGYLTLNRLTKDLSGGEYQRIQLATALGSALVGSMYILDEPSIGLHPRDTQRLVQVLKDLRDLGNTVIVVEHEEEVMQAADQIIDLGPNAGSQGGELILSMSAGELEKSKSAKKAELFLPHSTINEKYTLKDSHTYNFLKGFDKIDLPTSRRAWHDSIDITGARQHNLQNVSVKFPLNVLTVVTGVSGSGKSTLVKQVFLPALRARMNQTVEDIGKYDSITGGIKLLQGVEYVDQNPIGRSARSNPATYTKVYDHIRDLFADQPLSKKRGYTSAHFSFNVEKGRCDTCEGDGKIKIEMQFMADVYLTCESCEGKRFKKEILEVTYQDKNIADVLEMTIDEALVFFEKDKKVLPTLRILHQVGLGYVGLGQSASTLSGGEAQRLKLANFLKEKATKTLFIFDEPTTGLHFHDIKKLLVAIDALVNQGNTVIIIEHNLEVIKCADWIIDLGPDSGNNGGKVCFEGTPEAMKGLEGNFTADFLKYKI
jgi:excinuclease ABC subunit A